MNRFRRRNALVPVLLAALASIALSTSHANAADLSECQDQANSSCLVLGFTTGGDDLRGGNDNLNVTVSLRGVSVTVPNVNKGGNWGNGSFHQVGIDLKRRFGHQVMPNEISGVTLHTTFGGGIGGDNWNLQSMSATAQLQDVLRNYHVTGLAYRFGNPLFRFTGERKDLTINW
ncbi:hypothetical protein ACH4S8_40090 [Streptomyces sp. NPDC021080]|uniref:hypothetical protein n=1 Tax=Streptomyces sp. NPDC021080 TaxID=3365110 RepID=UPI0037BA5FCB